MKRAALILFHVAAAMSLLLFVAVLLLWARSYFRWDLYSIQGDTFTYRLASQHGGLYFSHMTFPKGQPLPAWKSPSGFSSQPATDALGSASALFGIYDYTLILGPATLVAHGVSDWIPLLLSGISPWVWFSCRRRMRCAIHVGLCAACGYDLRDTPERCPECGTMRS